MYEPQTPDELIGATQQQMAKALLQDPINKILFTGESGVGKTTIAKMVAKELGFQVEHVNCRKINTDGIRTIVSSFPYNLFGGIIYFFDEVDALANEAQQALLTDIENLPKHVYIFCATKDPGKLRNDFFSRFTQIVLPTPTRKEITTFLIKYFDELGFPWRERNEDLTKILDVANGNIRTVFIQVELLLNGGEISLSEFADNENKDIVPTVFKKMSLDPLIGIDVSNYTSLMIGLCKYAIKIIKNNTPDSRQYGFATTVILTFGEGLPNEEITFYHKLLKGIKYDS